MGVVVLFYQVPCSFTNLLCIYFAFFLLLSFRYGHPKPKSAEALAERMHMFHWDKLDLKTVDKAPPAYQKHGNRGNGGWTTRRSFEG